MAMHFNLCVVDVNQLAAVVRNRINVLILDSRSFLEYNASHVINAINVGCAKLVKRRLQQNRLTIQEFLVHNCHWDVDVDIDIVVYDQNTQNPANLPPDSFMSVFLQKLLPVYKSVNFLKGGFLEFQACYPNLCEDEKAKFTPLTSISQPCLPISNNGPTRILSFLYLGSQHDALNKEVLESHNITYELNVSTNCPKPDFIQDARFMRIPVIDNYSDKLLPYFPRAFQFLDKVRESGGCVLVHCLAGISRSATVAIAYLMRYLKLSSDEAYRYVKAKRATISPNFNFLGQLLEYENQLQREKILNPKQESTTVHISNDLWNETEVFQIPSVPEKHFMPDISGFVPESSEFYERSVKSTNNKTQKIKTEKTSKIEIGDWHSRCIPVSSLKELNFTPCQAAISKPHERYSPRQSNLWSSIDSFVKTNPEFSEDVKIEKPFDFAMFDNSLNELEMPQNWPERLQLSPKSCFRSNSTSTSGLGSESSDFLESLSDSYNSADKDMSSLTSEEFGLVPMEEEEYHKQKALEDSYEDRSFYPKFNDVKLTKDRNHSSNLCDDCFEYSDTNKTMGFSQEVIGESKSNETKCDEDKKVEKPCGLYRAQSCPGILSLELMFCSSDCSHIFGYDTVHLRTTQASSGDRTSKQRNRYSCGSLDYAANEIHNGFQRIPSSFSTSGNTTTTTMSPSQLHQLYRHSMIQVS